MKAKAYLTELKNKHANLEQKIKEELKSPIPDTLLIADLKKRKLFLKDQISAATAA